MGALLALAPDVPFVSVEDSPGALQATEFHLWNRGGSLDA